MRKLCQIQRQSPAPAWEQGKIQLDTAASLKNINKDTIGNTWDGLKVAITQTCSNELGKPKWHYEDWFDENDSEIRMLLAEKRQSFEVRQSHYKNKERRHQYHAIRRQIQNLVRKIKNKWWIRKSAEIQSYVSEDFFAATRKLYGPSFRESQQISGKKASYPRRSNSSRNNGVSTFLSSLLRIVVKHHRHGTTAWNKDQPGWSTNNRRAAESNKVK